MLSNPKPSDAHKAQVKLWTPKTSGDWSTDNKLGRKYAETLISLMRAEEAPFMLGQRARELAEDGTAPGIIAGFYQAIAEELIKCPTRSETRSTCGRGPRRAQ